MRNDGRVDRATIQATPTWTVSFGDAGTDTGWAGFAVPIPEVTSMMLQTLLTVGLVFLIRKRYVQGRTEPFDVNDITNRTSTGGIA